jgi:hypothetical protein
MNYILNIVTMVVYINSASNNTTILCKKFWKMHSFGVSQWYVNCSSPFPHINVENCYFCVAQGSAVKIINIANGGRGKKTGNGGKNVFQNIFEHDCSSVSVMWCDIARRSVNYMIRVRVGGRVVRFNLLQDFPYDQVLGLAIIWFPKMFSKVCIHDYFFQ